MSRGRPMSVRVAIALVAAGLAGAASVTPATADVRDGVDAWKRGDYARALAEWRKPAERGDPDAQFNLGQAYKLGRGVPADQARAIDWFRKAAAQNHVPAQDNYGLALYQSGRKADAAPWLERSAARDEKRAELVLGTMLFNGDVIPRDLVRAYALVTRSSQQGLPQAATPLALMNQHVPEAQRRDGLAMAQQIAAARRPATGVASATTATSALPAALPAPVATTAARSAVPPVPTAPRPPAPPPPAPAPPVARAPAVTAPSATWRVQLGAFRDPGNARALWQKVAAQVGGTADYVEANGLTRLQAVGFASKAEAQRACDKAGNGCVVLAP